MNKVFHVALREFLATVMTKGFLIGILLPPAIVGVMVLLFPILLNQQPPRTEGRVAVIDQSGLVAPLLGQEMTPEKLGEQTRKALQKGQEIAKQLAPTTPMTPTGPMNQMMAQSVATNAKLTLDLLDTDAAVEAEKNKVSTTRSRKSLEGLDPRLVLVVIPKGAVDPTAIAAPVPATEPAPAPLPAKPDATSSTSETKSPVSDDGPAFEPFEMYSAPTLDVQMKNEIERAIARAILNARLALQGLNAQQVRGLLKNPEPKAITVTDQGERKSSDIAAMLIPGGFMFLLWIAVFSSGQALLTSTIEEKSTRVMEVLLSAASPAQILIGKVLGQMGVGLLMLGVYGGAGVAAIAVYAYANMPDPVNLVYFAMYFVIAFFLIACMMAAIGSAVTELREAQTLMGPIMLVLIIPMVLWMPILRNPNSTFAQVVSFIPPVSPFVMVLRLSGSEPVPFWQVPATLLLGALSVFVAAWAAAKVFRIGVLMYGKPPNLRTLITWVRMA